MKTLLKDLKDLPNVCVMVLFDSIDKVFYLMHTRNSIIELARNIDQLKKNVHPSRKLNECFLRGSVELKVLTTFHDESDPLMVKAEYASWAKEYLHKGYKNLRPGYKPVSLKLRVKVLADWRDVSKPLVYVLGVTNRNTKYVLGVFDDKITADNWAEHNFGKDKDNVRPYFLDSELTKAYHAEVGVLINIKRMSR